MNNGKRRKRKVPQSEIARRLKLNVSSVNKILNEVPGPVFHRRTIARVKREARRVGWKQSRRSKWILIRRIMEVLNSVVTRDSDKLAEIRRLVQEALKYGRSA